VIRVNVCVQDAGIVRCGNHFSETLDRFDLATFAEVWYTFDQSISDCRLPIADF
jgi:hypothetical protein